MIKLRNKKTSLIFFIFFIIFCIIIIKIFYLSIIKYNNFNKSNIFYFNNNEKRVDIVDKNNIILATDIKTKTLYLNKDLIENEEFIAKNLSEILNIDYNSLYKKIINKNIKSTYILIKKHIMPYEEIKIKKLPIASIVFEDDLLRFYPHNNLFSHVVGYTNIDKNGIIGIEEYYDEYLKNSDNKPLKLTLDIRIQEALRNELIKSYKQYKTNFIAGVIMEIKTGNVLAMVSIPDFNPNILNDKENTFNHVTYGNYELGSVYKIFTFANGLENNIINMNTKFDVSQNFVYNNFTIRDSLSVKNRKKINTKEAFSLSSNIATIQIAQKIGVKRQIKFFENLCLLEKLNIDLKQIVLPLQPRRWKEINLLTISYGYGLALSPLHIINAANAILNNGNLITPRINYNFNFQKKSKVISKETSDMMKELFKITVLKGTGKLAYINGYNIGGKTGTAEKISKEGYQKGEYISSFIGAFPMNDPEYSIFIVADRPKKEENGASGATIAGIVKDIILKIIPFLNLKPTFN